MRQHDLHAECTQGRMCPGGGWTQGGHVLALVAEVSPASPLMLPIPVRARWLLRGSHAALVSRQHMVGEDADVIEDTESIVPLQCAHPVTPAAHSNTARRWRLLSYIYL
jgi:hypothetical protein